MFAKFKEYLPYYRRNLKVALPVMLTQLGASLVGLFDSMMVGHYGTVELAAVSFSNAIFFTVMVFAMGALMGITPLIGIHMGEMSEAMDKRDELRAKISSLLQNGVLFTILLIGLMVLLLGGCIPFLDKFGQDPVVIEAARPYYILIVISIVPFLFFTLFKQFLEGIGNTFVAMIITMLMNGLNIFLNWVLIFGHFGLPAMGATGAGIATLISRIGMPICFFLVIYFHRDWKYFIRSFAWKKFNWQEIKHLFQIGLPIGGQTLLETVNFTLSFIFIGWLSKEALAAHQVANQMADMTFMVALGVGSATTIRVSHQLGANHLQGVRMASNASIHLVLLINTIGAALMIGLRNYIPLLFTTDTEVIAIASKLVVFAGLFQYADGMQVVGASMLRGVTDVKIPVVIAFVSYIVVGLPIGLLCAFPLQMGASGIWVGFIFGLMTAAFCFHIRFRKLYKRMLTKTSKPEQLIG